MRCFTFVLLSELRWLCGWVIPLRVCPGTEAGITLLCRLLAAVSNELFKITHTPDPIEKTS